MAQTIADLNAARNLLSIEEDFCSIDARLRQLARHVLLTNLDQADGAARRVRRARSLLARTLWDFSAAITEAVGVIERHPDADVPF